MGNYYCLMSGLPDLQLDNTDKVMSVNDVKELIEEEQGMSKKDAKLLSMFFLEADCRNLLYVLKDNEGELPNSGNYSREELDDLIDDALEVEFDDNPSYPPFLLEFIREYSEKSGQEGYFADDALMVRYWNYVKTAKNPVISNWADLNINISNILTAMIARQQGWNISDYVLGEGDVIDTILQSKSKDFDLGKEIDYVSTLSQIVDCDNPVEKERKIDALKWLWLEDNIFFGGFAVEAVYAYLCKAKMLERWRRLDPVLGRERFETIIENLRSEAKVPEEFKL